MRTYIYGDEKSYPVRVTEDPKVKVGTSLCLCNPKDLKESKEFFALLFTYGEASVDTDPSIKVGELFMKVNPKDFDGVVAMFEDPTV
jgi:hypothetical protein